MFCKSHYDHLQGNDIIRSADAKGEIKFINCSPHFLLKEDEIINLDGINLKLIKTPGHTPDSICIRVNGKLITGDTLFVGKVGGTYSESDARDEFESLKKLMLLPCETEVWPGHDYGVMPHSTIGYELKTNPFVKRLDNFSEFMWLKKNWAQYKIKHGIK